MPGDFHVHTRYSFDARGEPADCAARAGRLGLDAIGFSEHADFDPADHGYLSLDLEAYQRALTEVAEPGVQVWCGLEVDWQGRFEPEIRSYLADFDGHYVIGSVHFVTGGPLHLRSTFQRNPMEELYRDYRDAHLHMLHSGLFDVVGHLDFPKRYGVQRPGDMWPEALVEPYLVEVLAAVVEAGVVLEVNTGGLRKPVAEPSPSLGFLGRYAELGGTRVVLGSDAHHPTEVGAGFAQVLSELRRLGLEAVDPADRARPG